MVLLRPELALLITEQGHPSPRSRLCWNSPPVDVSVYHPYIIALEPKSKQLEVHNILNQEVVQTLPLPSVSGKPKDMKLLSQCTNEGPAFLLIASNTEVYALVSMSLEQQVHANHSSVLLICVQVTQLLALNKYQDAIQLVEAYCIHDTKEVAQKVDS